MEGWESPNHIANILVVPICSGTAHKINKFRTNVRHDEINSKKKKKTILKLQQAGWKLSNLIFFFVNRSVIYHFNTTTFSSQMTNLTTKITFLLLPRRSDHLYRQKKVYQYTTMDLATQAYSEKVSYQPLSKSKNEPHV